jgi:glutaredoxin
LLSAHGISFSLVDVAQDAQAKAQLHIQPNTPSPQLPQIFVDGKYKGICEQLEEANEFGEIKKWLFE